MSCGRETSELRWPCAENSCGCDVRAEIQMKGVFFAMAVFFVNGTEVTVEKNQRLLRYLRDTLHLTSVKDGCSEGACGVHRAH